MFGVARFFHGRRQNSPIRNWGRAVRIFFGGVFGWYWWAIRCGFRLGWLVFVGGKLTQGGVEHVRVKAIGDVVDTWILIKPHRGQLPMTLDVLFEPL